MRQGGRELEALLAAAREAPDDDAPRLVVADWLEEHGDEAGRAAGEFVRAQCRFAAGMRALYEGRPGQDDVADYRALLSFTHTGSFVLRSQLDHSPEMLALGQRQAELLSRYQARWLPAPLLDVGSRDWYRGLCLLDTRAQELRAAALSGPAGGGWVDGLRLRELTEASARRVAGSALLAGLARLELIAPCQPHLLLAGLLDGPPLPLAELRLPWTSLGDDGAELLAASPRLGRLMTLDLSRTGLTERAAVALAGSPHLRGLCELRVADSLVGYRGLAALAGSPNLTDLECLDATSAEAHDDGVAALTSSPLRAVRRLFLAGNRLTARSVRRLLEWPGAPALVSLNLSRNVLGDRGAELLATTPAFAGLRRLTLVDCDVGRAGGMALAASPHLGGLRRLCLRQNPLYPEARAALTARFGPAVDL